MFKLKKIFVYQKSGKKTYMIYHRICSKQLYDFAMIYKIYIFLIKETTIGQSDVVMNAPSACSYI